MKRLTSSLLTLVVALLMTGMTARAQDTGAKSNAQTAGQESKSAAKNTGKAAEKGATKAEDKISGKLDLNSASKEDLEKLPGIGPATADKIIANRPYVTKRDLLTKKIVGQKEYDAIRDKIVAHKATAKK